MPEGISEISIYVFPSSLTDCSLAPKIEYKE
jgi:hypothetical protein